MNTKLTINLRDGILDVEGSDDFVRSVYQDFKAEIAKQISSKAIEQRQIEGTATSNPAGPAMAPSEKSKQSVRGKRVSPSEGPKGRSGDYKPSFDPNLNLKGLHEFYDLVVPANAAEKILTFAIFLKENLQIDPCTADQIYTCFFTVKDRGKIPEAFLQAFRDTQSRTHFIQMNSQTDIVVTIPGNNHFETMKKRRAAAE